MELLLPEAARRPAAAAMHAQILALVGYDAFLVAVQGTIPTFFDLGITTALNHVAIQLFAAGLKTASHDEMMKRMPVL
jgi:hypothetical protein